jgi:hypothetical protein
MRHGLNFFSYVKNIKKCKDLRVLGLFAKICPKVFSLVATLHPRIIFIILIIILNLHDSSLSESDCNTGPKSLEYESGCKVVS